MSEKKYSEALAQTMDEEAKKVVDQVFSKKQRKVTPSFYQLYQRTLDLLQDKKDQVVQLAELLIKKETITHDDIVETIGFY